MRKLFISSCIGLTLYTFSFIPLKGPYYVTNEGEVVKQTAEETLEDSYHPKQYFLYDKYTSTMMTISMQAFPSDKNQVFQPNNYNTKEDYDNYMNYRNERNHVTLIYRKQKLDFLKGKCLFNDISSLKSSIKLSYFLNSFMGKIEFQFQKGQFYWEKNKMILKDIPINLTQNIISTTAIISLFNVRIENKDEQVILSKDNKQIELITALKKHFATIPSQNSTDFIHALPRLNQGSGKELLPKLYNYIIYEVIQNRLKKSKILAVWGLIPTEIEEKNNEGQVIKKIIESQVIGLAEDENGQPFHWVTDLKKDISVLMRYAEEIQIN